MFNNKFKLIKNKTHIPFIPDYEDFESLGFYPWVFQFKRGALDKYKRSFDKKNINPFVLNFILNNHFVLEKSVELPSLQTLLKYKTFDVEAYTLVLINGVYVGEISDEGDLPFSVYSDGVFNCLVDNPDFLQNRVSQGEDLFYLLNSAYLNDGLILKIEDGEVLDKPIHIISINIKKDKPIFFNPRIYIEIGEGAKVDLLQSTLSFDEDVFFENRVMEINLKDGAILNHYRFYNNSHNSLLIENDIVSCGTKSSYNNFSLSKNVGIVDLKFNFNLWDNVNLNSNAAVFTSKSDNVSMSANISHHASSSSSSVNFYGVADEESKIAFDTNLTASSLIFDVDTKQLSKILLMNEKSAGKIKPFQSIYSENVSAFHGAVVSGVKNDDLFFLQSRGIDYNDSMNLIKNSFILSLFSSIDNQDIKEEFFKLLWDN